MVMRRWCLLVSHDLRADHWQTSQNIQRLLSGKDLKLQVACWAIGLDRSQISTIPKCPNHVSTIVGDPGGGTREGSRA